MADEYSREFSARVFNGQSRLTELGFRQGGPAGHGRSFCALQGLHDPSSAFLHILNAVVEVFPVLARLGLSEPRRRLLLTEVYRT